METKQEFLDELKKELDSTYLSNKEEIYQRYQDKFDREIQEGTSEKEIISMLKTPKELVLEEINKGLNLSFPSQIKNLNIKLVADNLTINNIANQDSISLNFENIDYQNYSIDTEDNTLNILFSPKEKFFDNAKKGKLILSIPSQFHFENINITSVSSQFNFDNICTETFKLNSVSSTINCENFVSENLSIKLISGKIEINKIDVKNKISINAAKTSIKINSISSKYFSYITASGEICIKDLNIVNQANLDTISSKILIENAKANCFVLKQLKGQTDIYQSEFNQLKTPKMSLAEINIKQN